MGNLDAATNHYFMHILSKAVLLLWIVFVSYASCWCGVCCNVVSVLCSRVVTCWERADLLAIVCVLSFVTFPVVSWFASELGVGLAPWGLFKPSRKKIYWPFQGGPSFVDLLCLFCLVFAMPLWTSIYMCLVVTCWERADLFAPFCGVLCWLPIVILGQVWYSIVSIPDLCTLLT